MHRVLLISSFCASSHVGSVGSAFVLRRLGVEVTVLPTTLFGRHPGWGAPGGGVVPTSTLRGMWDGVRAQVTSGLHHYDAVMTGYMGETDHIALACEIIDTLSPDHVLVDPVMGDGDPTAGTGALYIPAERAEALCDHLIPRAHIVTPNVWEWRYITGSLAEPPHSPPRPLAGTRETLVTSVPQISSDTSGAPGTPQIGAQLFAQGRSDGVFHERFDTVPHGGGDALAALYLAHRLGAVDPGEALQRSVSSIFQIMQRAEREDAGELPVIRAQSALMLTPTPCPNARP